MNLWVILNFPNRITALYNRFNIGDDKLSKKRKESLISKEVF